MKSIVVDLIDEGKEALIYCRRNSEVADVYELFYDMVGKHRTSPPGCPNLSQYRVFEMYSGCTDSESIVARGVTLQVNSWLSWPPLHLVYGLVHAYKEHHSLGSS